ncbi:MAG TPA: IS4 family transposase [Chloroflexota bacterium]|nr:IS4 family transposase [Chloroflexota bacterium]
MLQEPYPLAVVDAHQALDRLTALEQVICPQVVQQALQQTGRVDARACTLTYEVTLWVVLAMGIFTDLPIRQVFQQARRLRPGQGTPHRSSLCLARQRLGVAPVRRLFELAVRPLASPDTPGAFYHGLRLMTLDGTVLDVPDTDANAAAFGRPTGGRGDGAFPQVRKLSLVEVGTHVEVAFVAKGIQEPRSGEQSLAPALFRYLSPGMLLVWDRNFFSYALWKKLGRRRVQVLARVSNRLVLKPLRYLADGSYLAKIYRNAADRRRDRRGLRVRVIRYTLDDPQRVGQGEEHVLITTLMDAKRHPARELIRLYHERWEVELVYDEQKTHQDPRRATKPAHLRSGTPEGVRQELYSLSLGHYVVRAFMVQAAALTGLDTDRLSFTGCLQTLRCRLAECPRRPGADRWQWYQALLWELNQERTDDVQRRNRINPRVVKRKMSKFAKKRPEHRRPPPLQKTFAETVVLLC